MGSIPTTRAMKTFKKYLSESDSIITVYHGSKNKISSFAPEYLTGGHDQRGPGLYTTIDPAEGSTYGKHLHRIRLDTSNFITPKTKVKKSVIKDLVHSSPHFADAVSNWHENPHEGSKHLIKSICSAPNMHEALERTWYDAYHADNHAYLEQVSMHYHGAVVHPDKFRPSHRHFIIWNGRAIKSIHHEGE